MEPIEPTASPLHEENFACAPSPKANDGAEATQSFGKMGKYVPINIGMQLNEAEREIILATLNEYGGNKRRTATVLGISLKTLYNRLATYQNSAGPSAFAPDAATMHPPATESMAPPCSKGPAKNPTERQDG